MLVPVWSLSSGVNSTPTPMVSSSVGGGNLRYFILPSTAAGQLPPARHHDSSPHAGPRLPSDPAHLWVRAGAVQHSRPAADGLPGPPEAHHVCVGGECGTSLQGHACCCWEPMAVAHWTSFQGSRPCHHCCLGPVLVCLRVE